MLVSKQKYYFFLLVFLLLPFSLQAAWSEPSQVPPGGNVPVPVYTTGSGQTIDGTLHVGTPGSYATGLQGTGSTNGIQGNSSANALFGNLSNDGSGGDRAVYGLAVDAADYAAWLGGGLGLGFASGDIWFIQRDAGIAWPRVSDGQALYGLYVTAGGELQVRGHGGGINFTDQTITSRLTISEAGATNVVTGPLTVGGTAVCLSTGVGCPTQTTPTLQVVTTAGNTTTQSITVATIDTGQGATEAHLMNQNLRTSDSPTFGNLTVSNDIFAINNKSIRIDANNDTNLIFGNYNGNGGAFTYNGTYDLNLAVEGDVKASQFCFGAADCRTSWTAIGGASGWTDDGATVRLTTIGDNVGIGTTDPAGKKLKVQGLAEITSGLTVGGSISAGDNLNMNTHNILSVGKITVGTVDPVYEISGKKYATFASSIAGGVKEEYVGTVYIKDKSAQKNGEYELAINFDKAEEGSDLWVWRQTVDFNKNNVNVLITPYGAFARTYYLLAGNKIILRSDQPVEAAIRLIGKRFDWRDWPTLLPDQTTNPSFKIK